MREIVKLFKILSDSTRLRILMLLLKRELCVCELMFVLKMGQSRVSHQLRILKDADLVEDMREAKWIIYRIREEARPNLEFLFNQFFREKVKESEEKIKDLRNLKICLKEEVRKRHSSDDKRLKRKK